MKNSVITIIVIAASALATAQVLPPQRIAALPDQPRHVSREDFQPHAGSTRWPAAIGRGRLAAVAIAAHPARGWRAARGNSCVL